MTSSLSPLAIVLAIVLGLAVLGAVIALLHNLRRFSGFSTIARDVGKIGDALNGDVFRDGGDLVVAGNFRGMPTVIRFSNKEDVPGLNMRMGVPANFTLWIGPRSAEFPEGRAALHLGDALLDKRFSARSDDPGQARLFLALQTVPRILHQLAYKCGGFVTLAPGSLEISELDIPGDSTAKHVLDHLQTVATLADVLKKMPGSDTIKVEPLRKETRILGRAAIVAGVVVTTMVVVVATQNRMRKATPVAAERGDAPGILLTDATRIAALEGWRAATADDFDPNAVAWLRASGAPVSGRIPGSFSGPDAKSDVAYVLVRSDGMRRIVLLVDGVARYDVRYPAVAIVARIPNSRLRNAQWQGSAPVEGDGDGLLIVRAADDPHSGLVLWFSSGRVVTAVPENYQALTPQ